MDTGSTKLALREIGLSEHEITIYLGLLESGGADAASLSRQTGIKRTTVYPILERLIEQGVVMVYDEGTKKFFRPLKPASLSSLYSRKLDALTKVIPKLESIQGKDTGSYGVRLIKTKNEFETFYTDILREYKGKEYYVIGSASGFLNVDRDFLIDFRKRRAANNTRVKLIMSADSKREEGQNDPRLLRTTKFLSGKFNFKSTIDIYDNKIVIIGPEVKAMAVVIEIAPMVDVFRSVFEAMWEMI